MIYSGEYNIQFDIPTDNFVLYNVSPGDLANIQSYITNIKQSIKNKSTLIILFSGFENLYEDPEWIEPLNDFAEQIPNPIVMFNGKLSESSIVPRFPYYRISLFDHVSNVNLYSVPELRIDKPHKFYWASSKDLYPRRYVLAGLVKNNLLENSLINYKCISSNIPSAWLHGRFDIAYINDIENECSTIAHLLPLPPLDDTIEFNLTEPLFYTNSYLGIVTDTFYETEIFLSEKVFNAMNYYQIFFYIGPAGTLEYLRNKGYNTFDSIIDTSYDSIEDNAQRLFAARKSLLNFLNRPISAIRSDYIKVVPELENNKKLVSKQRPDLLITKYIQQVLDEHRKTNSNFS